MLGKSRRRHPPRGAKRGRPRGSRRGGGTGSLGRSDTTKIVTSAQSQTADSASIQPSIPPTKRGPGRPRLKPNGPGNQGNRAPIRIRKPIGPLVVPLGLGKSPAPTPPGRSPAMSPAPSINERGLGFYQTTDEEIYKEEELIIKQESDVL